MFRFAYPGLLFLLLLLPVVVLLYYYSRKIRKRRLKKLGNIKLLDLLMPMSSKYKPAIRLVVIVIALAAIILAYARPWGGVTNQDTTKQGIEIVIAVDASNSMLASATGEENGIDRMRTSKLLLEKLINKLSNDRVGLIAYAGDAYTLIPVTNDYVSAKTFLNSIDPSLIPYQGTNISAAIETAMKSFSPGKDIGKAIILLTDADELENPDAAIGAVKEASKMGIQTDVIGIGASPVTIPDLATGGRMIDEDTGEVVRTGLNEDLALEIAHAGNGIYVSASNSDALDELMKQIGKIKKSSLESSFTVVHDELYIIFVIIALVFLLLDFTITDKKNRWLDRITFFKKDKIAVMALLLMGTSVVACSKGDKEETDFSDIPQQSSNDSIMARYSLPKERDLIGRGNDAFYAERYESADSIYAQALNENKSSVVAPYNAGMASMFKLLQMQQQLGEQATDSILAPYAEKAASFWRQAATPLVEKGNVSSKAFFNLGNFEFAQERYDQAITNYKEALRLNPGDDHARRNLRIAQLKKKDNQDQNQDQNQNQQQQDQQDQQQQQQQPQPQNINEQTSQQILEAAERKENQRRMQMKIKNDGEPSGRHNKKW